MNKHVLADQVKQLLEAQANTQQRLITQGQEQVQATSPSPPTL